MITCWNAEGKEVEMPEGNEGDDDMTEITAGLIPVMMLLSQQAKQIITKIKIEDDNMVMVLEQK